MILEKDDLPMIARWLIELSFEHHSIVGEVEVGFFIKNFLDGEINWIASLSWICHLDRRQLSALCDAQGTVHPAVFTCHKMSLLVTALPVRWAYETWHSPSLVYDQND